jgi:hypothetical protein
MTLTDLEYKTFSRLHLELLFYVGLRSNIIADSTNFKDFGALDFSIKVKCRDFLLDNKKMVDDYTSANFHQLTTEQVTILKGFKKAITSNFILYKCLTQNAIFIDTKNNVFYAVKALGDSFYQFFNRFPVLINTTILPFNDQIIYDGFIKSNRLHFDSDMVASMKEDYKLAKKDNRILRIIQ